MARKRRSRQDAAIAAIIAKAMRSGSKRTKVVKVAGKKITTVKRSAKRRKRPGPKTTRAKTVVIILDRPKRK